MRIWSAAVVDIAEHRKGRMRLGSELLGELLQVGEDRDDLPAGLCDILMRLRVRGVGW